MKVSKPGVIISIMLMALLLAANVFAVTPFPTVKPTPTVTTAPTPIPPSILYRMNVHEVNNCGKTANDLEIFIKGNVQVLDWWHDGNFCPFQSITYIYDPVTDTTTVRFYDGTVVNGQHVDTCIFLNQNIKEYRLRRWSFDGVPGPIVGAALSAEFVQLAPNMASITFTNTPVDGGDETIAILQIGSAKRLFTFEELTWVNPVLDKEVAWSVTINNVPLKKGGSITIPSIPMPVPAAGLVYRLKVALDSEPENTIEYVSQFATGSVSTH